MNPYRPQQLEPALLCELIFTNLGASWGDVQDVALLITFPDKKAAVFRSMVVSTDQTHQLGQELGQPKLESFVGFQIKGRDSLGKEVMFVLEPPGTRANFIIGTYSAEIRVLTDKQSAWQAAQSFSFAVDQGDLDVLAKTRFTPQPDGRLYVYWARQSKVTREREASIDLLISEITKRETV